MSHDKHKDNDQVLYNENICLVQDGGKYIHIDWLIEDFDPAADSYMTEFGSCPKQLIVIDGTAYIKADCSIISKS